MKHHLVAEISERAVVSNLRLLRARIGAAVKLFPVVKANAYGHGLDVLLPVIEPLVEGLAVATYREAVELRGFGYTGPVLVFFTPSTLGDGSERDEAITSLLQHDLIFTVATEEDAAAMARLAGARESRATVHVKIDTGMNRSGAREADAIGLLRRARENPALAATGAYTHFATAEEPDAAFAREQLERFLLVVEAAGGREGLDLHAANSAAVLRLPETHLDLVRPGLAVYGYSSVPGDDRPPLQPCLRLVSNLVQVKSVEAGARTGYGLTYRFESDGVVGTVPVGYADGYPTQLANRAVVGIDGRYLPARGRVSMDQIVVELTDLESAVPGVEVEIVSPSPEAPHSIESLARLTGTIPYELTVGLGSRVHRRLVA